MTAYPGKGGEVLEFTVESALGTASTYSAIRMEDGSDMPTDPGMLAQPSHLGRYHWADTDDSPIFFESYREGALKLGSYVRGNATASSKPALVSLFESSGLAMTKTTSVNCDAYTNSTSFSGDGAGGGGPGDAFALQVDDGNHWPFLLANTPASATYNFTPGYAVPGSIAAPASNDIYGAYCLTPRARQVPTTATVGFRYYTRQQHTSNQMVWTYSGCAMSEAPKLTFEPGKPIKLDMGFHVGDIALSDTAYSGSDSTAEGQEQFVIWGGASSQFAFANSNTDGAISAGTVNLIKAEVDFAHKCVPIVGTGTTATVNNLQGYMAVPGHAMVTLTILCDAAYWTDLTASTNQMKYIHFAAAGSTSKPFFGAFFPRCQQVEFPKLVDRRGDYMQVVLKYKASSSNWGSATVGTVDTDNSAPWAIVLGRAVAA